MFDDGPTWKRASKNCSCSSSVQYLVPRSAISAASAADFSAACAPRLCCAKLRFEAKLSSQKSHWWLPWRCAVLVPSCGWRLVKWQEQLRFEGKVSEHTEQVKDRSRLESLCLVEKCRVRDV